MLLKGLVSSEPSANLNHSPKSMNKTALALSLTVILVGAASADAQTAATPPPAAPPPAAAPAAAAPAAPAPPSWSTTVAPTYVSEYMFRGVKLGGNSFEPSVTSTYGNWTLEVWANDPISNSDKVPGQSDPEIDPQGSYTFTINDSTNIQPGFTWYTYVRAPTNQGFYRMTFEPNVALNYTAEGVTVTPKIYYDMVLKGPTYELDFAYTTPLKAMGSEIDWVGTVGAYDWTDSVNSASPKIKTAGEYWLLGFTMPFTLNKSAKLILGYSYTGGGSAYTKQGNGPEITNTAAVNRGVVTVSLAWTF